MSEIQNGVLDLYGAEPFKQQQFGTSGIKRVNIGVNKSAEKEADLINLVLICLG